MSASYFSRGLDPWSPAGTRRSSNQAPARTDPWTKFDARYRRAERPPDTEMSPQRAGKRPGGS